MSVPSKGKSMSDQSEVKLTVSSARGSPDPPNGIKTYNKGDQVSCKVTSPVTMGRKVWTCDGWVGTGSVPSKGVSTDVTFPITEDSTITWNWVGCQLVSKILSIVAFVALILIVIVTTHFARYAFIDAVSAGALGGLAHEIVQSQGKYILPNTDETGNFCLGGLIGIITGGTAGLLTYQGLLGTTPVTASTKLLVAALVAGLAIKGVADAPNPPKAK